MDKEERRRQIEEAVRKARAEQAAKKAAGKQGAAPTQATGGGGASSGEKHKFWATQPVPQLGEKVREEKIGPLEPRDKPIRKTPLPLPKGFDWVELDVLNTAHVDELYQLLYDHYVEDDDAMFRFDYSRAFLAWALQPPGWRKDWHVGVRAASGKLLASITAVPVTMVVRGERIAMVEINFLCINKALRAKRLAPVLIKEITRRVNLTGVFQATYTAGVRLPSPVAVCRYYHRILNLRKCADVGFTRLRTDLKVKTQERLVKTNAEYVVPGFRAMEPRDVPAVTALLESYLAQYQLRPSLDEDEVRHWLLPVSGVIDSFVVEGEGGAVTDFVSFYTLSSSVLNHPKHTRLNVAYMYLYATTAHTIVDLMPDVLCAAKKLGFDVVNALDLAENRTFFKKCNFGTGDGNLHYYLYNWAMPELQPDQVGLVLL